MRGTQEPVNKGGADQEEKYRETPASIIPHNDIEEITTYENTPAIAFQYHEKRQATMR
jgi:hypothetical protein